MDEGPQPLYEWGEARYVIGTCHRCGEPRQHRYRKKITLCGQKFLLLLCRKCVEWVDERLQQRDPALNDLIVEMLHRFKESRARSKS